MSLLPVDQDPAFQRLANELYRRQLEQDEQLDRQLDERAKLKMLNDAHYNVDVLHAALSVGDAGLFAGHARWLYQLLLPLMTYLSRERLRDVMVDHYELMRTCAADTVDAALRPTLDEVIDAAVAATMEECAHETPVRAGSGRYREESQRYLDCLLRADTKAALALVSRYVQEGIPLDDVYVDVVAEAMRTVGDLWQRHEITVDIEHCCTSITQTVLAQLYPLVFEREHEGRTVVVACVGSELHELGARMVADLFEYEGWESVYLGADVPAEELLAATAEHRPSLVALSVTLPQHLPLCLDVVERLRAEHPGTAVAVGGNAFAATQAWRDWDVDFHGDDARELVRWACGTLV